MVFGFLVTIALIIMLVFALKTRQKIGNYGKSNILWKKVKVIDEMEPPRDVEAWVSHYPGDTVNHEHLIRKVVKKKVVYAKLDVAGTYFNKKMALLFDHFVVYVGLAPQKRRFSARFSAELHLNKQFFCMKKLHVIVPGFEARKIQKGIA